MQPITQARVSKLEVFGLDTILDMVREGAFLSEIAERLSAVVNDDISKSLLSRWLSGNLRRNVPLGDQPAETKQQATARGLAYASARKDWADSYVEREAQKLRDEEDDKRANLRRAQAEFALKLAGIFDRKYQQATSSTKVEVNVGIGDAHLTALMRRRVAPLPVEQEVLEITVGEALPPPALTDLRHRTVEP